MIGIDGGTWDLMGPWADSGDMPNLARLRASGAWGPLRSVRPNLTPPGWATAFTGVNPGKHGIFDFFALDPGASAPRVTTSADRRAPALWEILASHGLRSGVFNVPCTYPADAIPGFFLTGMGTPAGPTGGWLHPPEDAAALREAFPSFRFGVHDRSIHTKDLGAFLDSLHRQTDLLEGVALWLLRRHDPKVLLFVYDDVDRLMHFFWRFMDGGHPRHDASKPEWSGAIRHYYRRIDEGIGRFLEAMGPGTDLCLLSDHGFGPLHTDIYLNRVLSNWGLLRARPVAREMVTKPLWKRMAKRALPPGARAWFRTHVKPSPLANPLGFIDWKGTRAFFSSVSGRSVTVNLRSRQPEGTVAPGEEYEDLRRELRERLLGLKDPQTGQAVIQEVRMREEVYSGPHAAGAPDLILQQTPTYGFQVEWSGAEFAPASQYGMDRSGDHRELGVLLLAGPSFRPARLVGARIEDVTPTLLHNLSLPVGDEMDGRVLEEALASAGPVLRTSYAYLRRDGGSRLSGGEEAELAAKLKDLGYM